MDKNNTEFVFKNSMKKKLLELQNEHRIFKSN